MRALLIFGTLFSLVGLAASGPHDGSVGPVGVVSSSDVVSPGTTVPIQIVLNEVPTSDTKVKLKSDNDDFAVPKHVIVPAGQQVFYTAAVVSPDAEDGPVRIDAHGDDGDTHAAHHRLAIQH